MAEVMSSEYRASRTREIENRRDPVAFFELSEGWLAQLLKSYLYRVGLAPTDFPYVRDKIDAACAADNPVLKNRQEDLYRIFKMFDTMALTDMDGRPVKDLKRSRAHFEELANVYRKDVEQLMRALSV